MKKGKKYLDALAKVDRTKLYTLEEAVKLVKETSVSKFDGSVEMSVRLNLDTRKSDQQLRGAIVLPNGTGKEKKVLVVAKGDYANAAREAGADFVGDTDILEKIEKENWLDFDVMIATPDMMPLLGKSVTDVKKGRVEYKTDSYGIVHALVGKVSFDEKALSENINALMSVILKSKPSVVKGIYVKGIALSTTMGPGIKLDLNSFDK